MSIKHNQAATYYGNEGLFSLGRAMLMETASIGANVMSAANSTSRGAVYHADNFEVKAKISARKDRIKLEKEVAQLAAAAPSDWEDLV